MAKWILCCALAAAMLAAPFTLIAGVGPKTSPPIPPLLLPATGYWYDAERPGTGFALQNRDGMLGLVFFHFREEEGGDDRDADWLLAAGPLNFGTFEARLAHFAGGSCLGCDPFVAAQGEETETVVRLVFASAREATLQVGDGAPRRVVAMAYGVPYEPELATPADLPLPDLRGRWVLDGGEAEGVITLDERIATDGAVEYRGTADTSQDHPNASLRCVADHCALWLDALPATAPVPLLLASFPIGDITEERMTGADGMTFHVRAFRLHDAEGQP